MSKGVQLHFDVFSFFVFGIFFLEGGGGVEYQNITKCGPSLGRKRNAIIEMAFRWRTDDDPTLNVGLVFQGIRTNIARKPYTFVIF